MSVLVEDAADLVFLVDFEVVDSAGVGDRAGVWKPDLERRLDQHEKSRRGAGSMPAFFKISHTVE
jgi:hypothetical protein